METKPDVSKQKEKFTLEDRLNSLTDENEQLKDEVKRLKRLAVIDPLTGAYNRRFLNENLQNKIEEAKRYHWEFSLIMYDFDHFKKINDTYGHQAGDYVLKEVAQKVTEQVKSTIRGTDLLARYGGEEFIIILPQTNLEQASVLAERIRKEIEETDFNYNNRFFPVTVSFGVTEYTYEKNMEQLIGTVDKALYQAKQNGRNRIIALK
jgi:diguanylate cyclase (GGDEF)-like protein